MELTEQQRMDLINAGWTPPNPSREEILMIGLRKRRMAVTEGDSIVIDYDGPSGHFKETYTAEEYNAALERCKA